jgi:hypothetical protein
MALRIVPAGSLHVEAFDTRPHQEALLTDFPALGAIRIELNPSTAWARLSGDLGDDVGFYHVHLPSGRHDPRTPFPLTDGAILR